MPIDVPTLAASCVSTAALGIVGIMLRRVEKKMDAKDADNAAYRAKCERREAEAKERREADDRALGRGVMSLMRQTLIEHHDRVMAQGFYPNDAERESIHEMFLAYKELGGDGVIDVNHDEIIKLPTQPGAARGAD